MALTSPAAGVAEPLLAGTHLPLTQASSLRQDAVATSKHLAEDASTFSGNKLRATEALSATSCAPRPHFSNIAPVCCSDRATCLSSEAGPTVLAGQARVSDNKTDPRGALTDLENASARPTSPGTEQHRRSLALRTTIVDGYDASSSTTIEGRQQQPPTTGENVHWLDKVFSRNSKILAHAAHLAANYPIHSGMPSTSREAATATSVGPSLRTGN